MQQEDMNPDMDPDNPDLGGNCTLGEYELCNYSPFYPTMMKPFTIVVVIGSIVGMMLQLRTLKFVWKWKQDWKSRNLSYLIGNLSISSFLGSIFEIMFFWDTEQKNCSFNSFMRNVCVNVTALTALAITYERRNKLKRITGHVITALLILIWVIATSYAFPKWFFAVYDHEMDVCLEDIFVDTPVFAKMYEIVRCIFFHIAVAFCIGFELFKIRHTLECFFIRKVSAFRRITKKVLSIRFLCMHSTIFIITWLTFGICVSYYEFDASRLETSESTPKNGQYPVYFLVGIACYNLYLCVWPITVYCTSGMFHSKPTKFEVPQRARPMVPRAWL